MSHPRNRGAPNLHGQIADLQQRILDLTLAYRPVCNLLDAIQDSEPIDTIIELAKLARVAIPTTDNRRAKPTGEETNWRKYDLAHQIKTVKALLKAGTGHQREVCRVHGVPYNAAIRWLEVYRTQGAHGLLPYDLKNKILVSKDEKQLIKKFRELSKAWRARPVAPTIQEAHIDKTTVPTVPGEKISADAQPEQYILLNDLDSF